MSDADVTVHRAELMMALSTATDLAMGRPVERAMASAALAVRLGGQTGFPNGLRGDAIAIPARVLAAANAHCEMTEDRGPFAARSGSSSLPPAASCAPKHAAHLRRAAGVTLAAIPTSLAAPAFRAQRRAHRGSHGVFTRCGHMPGIR